MENSMNPGNKRNHEECSGVKEEPADCIIIPDVTAALKKMKKHKGQGLSQQAENQPHFYFCSI